MGGLRSSAKAGKGRRRKLAHHEELENAPEADAASVLEHRLGGEVALTVRHGGYWAFGQGRLGEAIAVGDRVFRAFFDIEAEVEREPSTVRPPWIRRLSAVADEIAGILRHVILVWAGNSAGPHSNIRAVRLRSFRASTAVRRDRGRR